MLGEPELSAVDQLSLGLSRTYYALARALRLTKLRDLLGSSITLDAEAQLFLLGCGYSCPPNASEAQQEEVSSLGPPAPPQRAQVPLPPPPAPAPQPAA